jgi:hypothetical protein
MRLSLTKKLSAVAGDSVMQLFSEMFVIILVKHICAENIQPFQEIH